MKRAEKYKSPWFCFTNQIFLEQNSGPHALWSSVQRTVQNRASTSKLSPAERCFTSKYRTVPSLADELLYGPALIALILIHCTMALRYDIADDTGVVMSIMVGSNYIMHGGETVRR